MASGQQKGSSLWKELVSRLEGNGHVVDLFQAVVGTIVSVLPIVLLLILFNVFILKNKLGSPLALAAGTILVMAGLVLLEQGLNIAIVPLGETVGTNLASNVKPWMILGFVFIVGYAVALSEPILRLMGSQVEELSAGVVTQNMVVQTVAIGIGAGLVMGMSKIIFGIPTVYLIVPAFFVTGILAIFAPKAITGVAFDAAGVATGPVTVPVIMALGVGMASALGGRDPLMDGFGLIACAYIGPIIGLLILGIIFKL